MQEEKMSPEKAKRFKRFKALTPPRRNEEDATYDPLKLTRDVQRFLRGGTPKKKHPDAERGKAKRVARRRRLRRLARRQRQHR